MVNLASVILVVGIGLTIFFRKDITDFLNSLKGFGQTAQAVGGATQAVTEAGIATQEAVEQGITNITQIFVEPEKSVLKPVFQAGQETAKIFFEPEKSVLKPVFQAGQETAKIFFQPEQSVLSPVFEAGQQARLGFDQTQENIAKFFEDISQGFGTFFGGQQTPKTVLTTTTATQPKATTPAPQKIITAQQPITSLVSPFLKIEPEPTKRTRGEIRFGR